MIELTLDKAKELLAEAVALKGEDYVYTTPEGVQGTEDGFPICLYVHGDQPGCLVGHVLAAAGAPLATLAEHENAAASDLLWALYDKYSDDVSLLLTEAQRAQDLGRSWGESVRYALAELDGPPKQD